MKYLVIIGLLFLSSCCVVTSQDCFCNRPDSKINEKAFEWILSYENKNYSIFEDEEGNKDSLKIERISETEFCGGEECGSNCEIEIANLSSITNSEIRFNIKVGSDSFVHINTDYPREKYILFSFVVNNDYTYINEKFSLISGTDYFRIDCKNNVNCFGYPIKGMILSKQDGLIEYTTADNKKWTKVN